MASTATRQEAPKIYGVLPSLIFDDDVQVDLRANKEMLSDICSLRACSVVGIGIPYYDAGWQYKDVAGAHRKKSMPYWDQVIGALRGAGLRIEFLVPPTLKDAEIKHAMKATSADPATAFKHEKIRDYIHHVAMPSLFERSIREMRPAVVLCTQLHARLLAAKTGFPYLEETHDVAYLAESYCILKNDNEQYRSLQERKAGGNVPLWSPLGERDPDDGGMIVRDEADAPPVLSDIAKELAMEADENCLTRSPSVPSHMLFAQEMCARMFRSVSKHRVTHNVPSYIGTSSPKLPASGIFELHVTTNARGDVQGILEDVIGTAHVNGTISSHDLALSVNYIPDRCIRNHSFSEEYKGRWDDDRYTGTWWVKGTNRRGNFMLRPCK